MGVSVGTKIGSFEVAELLGAGGMGEVYRARDTRLGRDVALKVLPIDWALDAHRRARFEREARVLASLNHANIATLYGVEDAPTGPVLVMELVEGTTLADRIALGGRLALNDILSIARQVATALEAAHERGIIHRDLKPSNIAVRPDGTVKVLDFGLARALDTVTTAPDSDATATLSLANPAGGPGPGTPAYMSPEQARGLPADKRSDIWAFGCVLYELLTGRRPFAGDSVTEVVARILERDPDFSVLPPETPLAIRRLVRRCLEKESLERLRDIGDARLEIREALAPQAETSPTEPPSTRFTSRHWWFAGAAGAIVLAATAFVLMAWTRGSTGSPVRPTDPVRLTSLLPPGVSVARGPGLASSVAVSPDGRTLVVAGTAPDGQRLYVRPLDRIEATPLPETERGSSPFFSWDGGWVGFAADGRLKRVPLAGGAALDIAGMSGFPAGASWGPDNRIVFAYGADARLFSVDASGGSPEQLTDVGPAYRPDVLPDGRTVLFESGGWVHVLDRATGRTTRLVQGVAPKYDMGQVIFCRGTTLFAAPLDLSRHELLGPVAPFVEGVASESATIGGMRHYAMSRNGRLAYVPSAGAYSLAIVEPGGTERVLAEGHRLFANPRFSPDGRLVVAAAGRQAGEPLDLWIYDVQARTATRLTFDGAWRPLWMPDGRTVTYSERGGIYAKDANGGSDARQILALNSTRWLIGWTPDGRTLAYAVMEGTPSSIMALTDGQPRRVLGPASTWGGRLSRDGRWLVYYANDSGNFEVFVTPFPGAGRRWLIAEGTDPTWSPDGSEIYYRSGVRLMAARIDRASGFRVLSRRVVMEPFVPPFYDDYDIHPDGRTLVLVRPTNTTQLREVTMVLSWPDALTRVAPGK